MRQMIPESIQEDILDMENRGQQVMESFVKERVCGSTNLWNVMKKQKFLNWEDACKPAKLKMPKDMFR